MESEREGNRCCDEGARHETSVTLDRRAFLRRAALLGAAGVVMLSPTAWAARTLGGDSSRKRLVVVFMRGAVDGLNVVVPYGEPNYYESRPTLAIARAGGDGAVVNLDGFFGLHPALASIEPQWRDGTLAFVHACGSPDPTRSHFDAQDYMESGTPGVKSTGDGWMNRVLAVMPGKASPTEALSLGANVPRILSGRMPVANIALGRGAARPLPMDRPIVETAFDRMYRGSDALSHAYQEGRMARAKLMTELQQDMTEANNGAPSPKGFSDDTGRLAHLIARDPSIRLAFLALGGWDTHVNQGCGEGTAREPSAAARRGAREFRNRARAALPGHGHPGHLGVRTHRAPERQRRHRSWPWQRDVGDGRTGARAQGIRRVAGALEPAALPGARPRGDDGFPRADRDRAARTHGAWRHADRSRFSRPPAPQRPHRKFDLGLTSAG